MPPPDLSDEVTLEFSGLKLLNLAPEAMLIVDDQGSFVAVNPAACRLLHRTEDQLLGRTIADFCIAPAETELQQQWQDFLVRGSGSIQKEV
ncbi:MAG: PAS domain-containing protein, partial [Nodosilinea sp.]